MNCIFWRRLDYKLDRHVDYELNIKVVLSCKLSNLNIWYIFCNTTAIHRSLTRPRSNRSILNVQGLNRFLFSFYIQSFDSLQESTMDYRLTMFLRMWWIDPRLSFKMPKMRFANTCTFFRINYESLLKATANCLQAPTTGKYAWHTPKLGRMRSQRHMRATADAEINCPFRCPQTDLEAGFVLFEWEGCGDP